MKVRKFLNMHARIPLFIVALATTMMVANCNFSDQAFAESPKIYGSGYTRGQRVYLGNYNTYRFDPSSISNSHSRFGSSHSPNSVKNQHGKFGSIYSPSSVNNSDLWNGNLLNE